MTTQFDVSLLPQAHRVLGVHPRAKFSFLKGTIETVREHASLRIVGEQFGTLGSDRNSSNLSRHFVIRTDTWRVAYLRQYKLLRQPKPLTTSRKTNSLKRKIGGATTVEEFTLLSFTGDYDQFKRDLLMWPVISKLRRN